MARQRRLNGHAERPNVLAPFQARVQRNNAHCWSMEGINIKFPQRDEYLILATRASLLPDYSTGGAAVKTALAASARFTAALVNVVSMRPGFQGIRGLILHMLNHIPMDLQVSSLLPAW